MTKFTIMVSAITLQPGGMVYFVKTGELPTPLTRSTNWHKRHVPDYGTVHMAAMVELTGQATLQGLGKLGHLTEESILRNENFYDLTFTDASLLSIESDYGLLWKKEDSELLQMVMVNIPFAKKLMENGVTTLRQVAEMSADDLQALDDKMRARGRITDPEFQAQAKRLLD
jgi:hypothetical protein